MDSIAHWEQTKNCLALSASVQALSKHEDAERTLLMVLEEDSDVADNEYGHLGPVRPAALKEGLYGYVHEAEDYSAAFSAAATELAGLLTNNPSTSSKGTSRVPKEGEYGMVYGIKYPLAFYSLFHWCQCQSKL